MPEMVQGGLAMHSQKTRDLPMSSQKASGHLVPNDAVIRCPCINKFSQRGVLGCFRALTPPLRGGSSLSDTRIVLEDWKWVMSVTFEARRQASGRAGNNTSKLRNTRERAGGCAGARAELPASALLSSPVALGLAWCKA